MKNVTTRFSFLLYNALSRTARLLVRGICHHDSKTNVDTPAKIVGSEAVLARILALALRELLAWEVIVKLVALAYIAELLRASRNFFREESG